MGSLASPEKRSKATSATAAQHQSKDNITTREESPSSSAPPAAKRRRLNSAQEVEPPRQATHAIGVPHQARDDNPETTTTKRWQPRSTSHNHGMPLEAPESSKGKRKSHPSPEEKRSLRSKDSVPPKSDLEKYFPDFQAVVFGEQEDDGLPSPDTVIHIVDELPAAHKLPIRARNDQTSPKGKRASPTAYAISSKQHGPSSRRQNEDKSTGETLDLEALARQWKQANPNIKEDPLPDDHYKSAHKRAERKEKQSRNTDRERAMHEKSELERILGDLKGPDWLRTLGISGITETQKRQLEPKRDHFIQRVKGLLERFATWKDKEKRLKQRRDRRLARQQAQTKEDEGPEDSEDPIDGPSSSTKNYDDASARRPLRQAERKVSEPPAKRTKTSFSPPPEKPFTTFFAKPHLRAAAVGKHRRGRNVFAFGHPVPHMFEADFALPPDYLEETLMKSTKQ